MRISFDDAAAEGLASAARDIATALRTCGYSYSSAASNALIEFRGNYAELFRKACVVEAEDRSKIASRLDDLAENVERGTRLAAQERERVSPR